MFADYISPINWLGKVTIIILTLVNGGHLVWWICSKSDKIYNFSSLSSLSFLGVSNEIYYKIAMIGLAIELTIALMSSTFIKEELNY